MSDQPSQPRPGGTPSHIDPQEYPALAQLQQHCRRGGPTLIDRVYADALRLWKRCKEAEDLAGLTPAPPPKRPYGAGLREHMVQEAAKTLFDATQDGEELL